MIDITTQMSMALGISLADLILLVTACVLLLFYAVDIRMGVVLTFLFFSVEVIAFQALSLPTTNVVLLSFGAFVFLALSLYISVAKNNQAVF
jgi:hypothetical protein